MSRFLIRPLLAAVLLAASFTPYRPAASASLAQETTHDNLVQALSAQAGNDLRLGYHRGTGLVNFIGGTAAQPVYLAPAGSAAQSAEAGAQAFLASYGGLFGLTDPAQQLTVMRDRGLDDGRLFVRFQQQHNGIPIVGGELIVGLDGAKNVVSASGETLGAADLAMSTQPVLDAAAAQQIAIDRIAAVHGVPAADLTTTPPELWLYNPVLLRSDQPNYTQLVWRMDVSPAELSDIRELVLVEATSGKVALHFNQVDTAMNRDTYTGNNTATLPGSLLCNQANTTCGGDAHAAAAHLHAGQTYSLYLSYHGRDSLDGAGMALISTVHHKSGYDNAFWNGAQMIYGDVRSYPPADDMVAHELTHGVTQYESNLFYLYQSGAINESLSDIWGELLDQTNSTGSDDPADQWLLGEDVSPGRAIRNMADPTAFGDPDRMSSGLFWLGVADNGGVHHNSGINNKAAYLTAEGGNFNSIDVDAIGLTKTIKIYYEVQTNLLTSGSDYLDLYNALFQACTNLNSSGVTTAGDCTEVSNATQAVEMNVEQQPGNHPEAEICPDPGTEPLIHYFNGFELTTTGITTGADPGNDRWAIVAGNAHSGHKAFYGNNDAPFNAGGTSTWLAINPNVTLPENAFLHFAHAHDFETDATGRVYFDGGILEFSTTGAGGPWQDAGFLPTVNGYQGVFFNNPVYANPLNYRPAFVGDSHGYYSTRVDLSFLAGETVRFRWRMGLDNIIGFRGWFIDDVRIYRCSSVLPTLTNAWYFPFMQR